MGAPRTLIIDPNTLEPVDDAHPLVVGGQALTDIKEAIENITINVGDVGVDMGPTDTILESIDAKTPALGQSNMAGSTPVAIASNQSALPVTGTFFQATQPVSGPLTDAQLRATPVPVSGSIAVDTTGLATDAKQDTGNASLASIDGKLTNPLPVSGTFFQATQPVSGPITDTQLRASAVPVSAASLPLPSGAATSAKQDTEIASLASIDAKLANPLPVSASALPLPVGAATSANQATEIASLASIDAKLTNPLPVSGPLTDAQIRATALPVSAAALPLPSGASTSALQTAGNTSLASIDAKLTNPLPVSGTFFQTTQPVSGPLTDTQLRASAVPVSAAALPLPSGAATSAKQDTEISSLASIDSKLTSPLAVQGKNAVDVAAGGLPDVPVMIAGITEGVDAAHYLKYGIGAQHVSNDSFGNPVYALAVKDYSGGDTATASADFTATEVLMLDSLRCNAFYILVTGTWTGSLTPQCFYNTPAINVLAREVGSSSPISSITANGLYLVEDAVLDALQVQGAIATGTASVFIVGYPTPTGTHAWQAGDWVVSAASLPLPAGASTAAKQDTGNTSLASIDGKTPALGQAAMASSVPVALASNQSALPVTGTFFQGTQPISAAALPLPSGASTGAKQDTGNASLASIDGKLGSLGQKAMAGSAPVVLASDQAAIPVTGTFWQGTQPVSGPLTDTQLRASAVPVSGTFFQGTQPVSLAAGASAIAKAEDAASADADVGVPAMAIRKGTPANTSGTDGDYEMLQISAGRLWASATIDAALPAGTNAIGKLAANDGVDVGDVTINNASGAAAVNIQDGGNSITVDATSLPLPTGAATGTKQDTGNASLASIDGKTPALGQAAMAASTPVTLASDQPALPVSGTFFQSTQPISATALPLPSNAAQESSGNLATIATQATLGADVQEAMLLELRAIRFAIVALLTNGDSRFKAADFDPWKNDFSNTADN